MTTWTDLIQAEPLLIVLERKTREDAEAAALDPDWSFSHYWTRTLKPQLKALVGWYRQDSTHPELRTETAWQIALDHLTGLLPDENADGRWAS